MKNWILCGLMILSFSVVAQDNAREWTVELSATVNEDPASITLNWLENTDPLPTTYMIWRKEKGTDGWGSSIGSVTSETLTFTDLTVETGISYEYHVQFRLGGTVYAWGYINSGINVELDPNKGDMLLIIDENFTTGLATDIEQLEKDLYNDGWMVTTMSVDPESSPSDLKEDIVDYYETLPNLKGLYLLGNVPVPYSGDLYPDAHTNHIGAWPADVYYADMDGEWTDTDVNNVSASSPRNHNIPGDGKFDQSKSPSTLELQVSRVDMNDLPVFGETEEVLLQNYLVKAHEFKMAEYVPQERALVDQGGFVGSVEGFAQNGFRNFTTFFGSENIDHVDYWTTLTVDDYLWSYGCGGGSYSSAGALNGGAALTSADMASGFNQSSFTMLFGSYFGDWDVTNNLMRSAIANGRTLSCSWAGRPNWHYHHMAQGENLGYSALVSQDIDSDYLSILLGGGGFVSGEGVHVAQLGDPSLRLYYLAPPTDVVVSKETAIANVSWTASIDGSIEGYNVYRRTSETLWVKLNAEIITETDFADLSIEDAGEYEYLVKSVKLKTNSSGTFYNESLGQSGSVGFYVSSSAFSDVKISVYPNPAKNNLYVKSNVGINHIFMVDLNGKTVELNAINSLIDVSGYAAGVYFLQIETDNGLINKKFVKQ